MKALVYRARGRKPLQDQPTPTMHVVEAMKEGATLAFAAHGKVKADIAPQPLSSSNDIFERLQKGHVASRVVLDSGVA